MMQGKVLDYSVKLKTIAEHLITILNKIIKDESIDEELRKEISNLLPCFSLILILFF
jgi:hypothetical protein